MIQSKKVYGTLGLAMKAGKVVSGEFMTEKAIRDGMASLVIVAEDASANTKKKFKDSCSFYHVPCAFFGDKDTLGKAKDTAVAKVASTLDTNGDGTIDIQD